jgi:hypothetical protein
MNSNQKPKRSAYKANVNFKWENWMQCFFISFSQPNKSSRRDRAQSEEATDAEISARFSEEMMSFVFNKCSSDPSSAV